MRSFVTLLACLFIIFSVSCTKETLINPESGIERAVLKRSLTTKIQVSVVSNSVAGNVLTIEFSEALSTDVPVDDQSLDFTGSNGTVTHSLTVDSFSFVGGNLLVDFDITGTSLSGLDINENQSIIILEDSIE